MVAPPFDVNTARRRFRCILIPAPCPSHPPPLGEALVVRGFLNRRQTQVRAIACGGTATNALETGGLHEAFRTDLHPEAAGQGPRAPRRHSAESCARSNRTP